MNIYGLIKEVANNKSKNSAYSYNGNKTNYEDLISTCENLAQILIENKIEKGDKIAILLGNSPEFIQTYLAILKLGAIVIPLNPAFTESEIKYILNDSSTKLVIATSEQKEKLKNLIIDCTSLLNILLIDEIQPLQKIRNNIEEIEIQQDDTAVILYTSGTTGNPKGAMLSHVNLIENANDFSKLIELRENDQMVAVLPMFHSFCLTLCVNMILLNGASTIIIPKFNPTELVEVIKKEKATLIAAVPTIYNYLHQLKTATSNDFNSLRACISGGASIPIELLQSIQEKYNLLIVEGYGLSETAPVLTFNPYRGICKPGSVGLDLPSVQTKIFNENGEEVPTGEVGEVVATGPNVMSGYLNNIEATEKAFINGWFKTGDLGKKDEDGYLFLLDRKKDVIITNGYNVYPREIEERLYEHPCIIEAAVVGKPDQLIGESVCAYLVVSNDSVSEAEIIDFCRKSLVYYKVPKQICFIKELPKNSTGKILKRLLK
ncbi:long-chain-fatty-acid--CoA ligase [Bacillus sp. AFS017336]|uniref:long-chain-fatty-acid--CoA ligase n=1 Tax=Bacillus sp. AFS017336 TaxID=2033489 RepID=UPI000BF10D40|nr:long-chain-fatty-acid--CoA ligase [Bacillus sp. AFS017336]PEL13331.1 long-chain fatty acid--CoA ligase [Bacillus sp. AFS017336]